MSTQILLVVSVLKSGRGGEQSYEDDWLNFYYHSFLKQKRSRIVLINTLAISNSNPEVHN